MKTMMLKFLKLNAFTEKIVSGYGGIENCIWLWRNRKLYLAMEELKIVSSYGGSESCIWLWRNRKDTYYSNLSTKLVKQKSNPKTYWSALKRFLSIIIKIPCIPSLFQ